MAKTTASIKPVLIEGLSAYRIENSKLALDVIPELGGKIVSLRSGKVAQTEWLWKNDRIGYEQAALNDSYTQKHDSGGVDECFPSVDACTLPTNSGAFSGLTLPDHGELYARPWEVMTCETDHDGRAVLSLTRACETLPCEFQRTLTLSPDEGKIEFKYCLYNISDTPVPFSWCMHPALQLEPGMRLLLPEGHQLYCSYASDHAPLAAGDVFHWPNSLKGENLSVIPDITMPKGYAAKVLSQSDFYDCTTAEEKVIVGLENPSTEEVLQFELPPTEIPHIALWLNCKGWAGDGGAPYFNLVLEPAIGNADGLAQLVNGNLAPIVQAHCTREWSLVLRLLKH
ncbi:DUF5107 domain-containing protein [Microbulbifer mangrovi]|uniref:DUF5107 domain-containing protein n=1 Tax=Microbulbifer mangrovi TaxID=927787 RepID=UPI0013016C99|nr:DUF5107 domain-containing protein [Microbulbifer mangrovi]